MTATSLDAPSVSTAPSASGFRPEIQALRALAVMAVLVFHLWPLRLTGGFVGVDVFFVISGYLITSHLLGESTRTGSIRLGRFWARRAKRLLPSSLLVLAVTALAILAFVPAGRWQQFLSEIAASTLYVQNWLLAANSVDYLAATGNIPSPVQHFWTLSVEEQFYVMMPIVMLGACLVATRTRSRTQTAILIALASVTALSFGYSLWITATAAPLSYFSTFSRAWEFGVGALVAFAPALSRGPARHVLTIVGVTAIIASVALFDAQTPFPGAMAAVPVIGTALCIWGGRRTLLERIGSIRPVAFIGAVSYAIYLWHWPLIVLVPYVTGHELTTLEKVAILIASIVVAGASTRFVEDPVRFDRRLLGGQRRPRTVALWSVIGMAVVLSLAIPPMLISSGQASAASAENERLQANAECLGAAVAVTGCDVDEELRDVLLPSAADLLTDDVNRSECWSTRGDGTLRVCPLGPTTGYDKHILAVGDSHNNTLLEAYETIAEELNWRIDVAGRIGCYWTDAELVFSTDELTAECEQWRGEVRQHIAASTDLDAVLVTNARRTPDGEVRPANGESVEQATSDGLIAAWSTLPEDVPVLGLVDNPLMSREVITCVEREGLAAADACTVPRADALPGDAMRTAVEADDNARLIDLTDIHCEPDVCRPVIGNVIVYRDPGHLTATYAATLAPFLGERLVAALD
ncbi:acyltransferase family protein [Agromyces atrinae]|uniref:Acyltransferase n=1 Tax=Agromyces atrinae TaxID=592376 RepID=A0A4Q2M5T5_9MICO|nr:acyltransferase family protein [Agromyces atrinae]NYD66664.1 peptidoglycan/LPS O-acetylase OafA/YrhL [Agromyces atrinae]RXZ87329.1 acyltransferase [Agromyces atrinae]